MKNTIKVFGITALVAVFAMAGCASMTVVDVEWDTLEGPGKTRQYLGMNYSEVKVYAHYKNGDRRQAGPGSLGYSKDTAGTQTVRVSLGKGGGGTFQTEVMPLTGIRMISPPSKTTYNVGDKFDFSGLKVMGSWKDMPDAEIPLLTVMLNTTGFNTDTPGEKVVTINYKGYIARFNITVRAAAAAPAASQPAAQQPAQQQQPAAQQPSQSTSEFKPAANQPAPTGTWRGTYPGGYILYTFNANGTGRFRVVLNSGDKAPDISLTWTASGNRLTITLNYGEWSQNMQPITSNVLYSISGNTLTWQTEGQTATETLTRQ